MKKHILLLILLSTLSFSIYSQIPTSSLVGYWPFNGNVNDQSGFGNNGTVSGATLTTDRFGNQNSAYLFNGTSSYIRIPNSTSLNFGQNPFTISVWVKPYNYYTAPNSGNPNGSDYVIFAKEQYQSPDGMAFRLGIASSFQGASVNRFYGTAAISNTGLHWNSTNGYTLDSKSNASLNSWSLLTIVRDNAYYYLYINGIYNSKDSTSSNLDFSLNTNNIVIGYQPGNVSPNTYFNGVIDDIGIWKRVLSQQEIFNLYTSGICFQNTSVTDTLKINISLATFDPVTYKNTIKVYPNPTKDHITIDYGNYSSLSGLSIKITNSLGSPVYTTAITAQQSNVSMSNWGGNGLYFVYIIDGSGNTIDVKKIVLQ